MRAQTRMDKLLLELAAAAYAKRYDGRIEDVRRISDELCMEASRVRVEKRPWWARLKWWG